VELAAVALSDGPYSGRPGTSLQLLKLTALLFFFDLAGGLRLGQQ
jgi:hypothetical protein